MTSGIASMEAEFTHLYQLNLIPLRVIAPSLVWVLHDYFLTLQDEVRFIWPQKRSFGRFMFFFIRYYTVLLLVFDVAQIHSFARKGVPTFDLCLAMDPMIRIIGALSLWSVEIVMQLRVYALYGRSKKVALFNGIFFMASIGLFCRILVLNSAGRRAAIAPSITYPLPGCPVINGGSYRWAIWIPATIFELNLLVFALWKTISSASVRMKLNDRVSLLHLLLQDNILYFIGVALILILNNLMTISQTGIPWFSFGPFHAALGIMTSRMHLHLVKFTSETLDGSIETSSPIDFGAPIFPQMVEVTLGHKRHIERNSVVSDDEDLNPIVCHALDIESVAESSLNTPSSQQICNSRPHWHDRPPSRS